MARPKSTKPIKDKILSIRLTKEDYMKIKKVYGSVQAFLDLMIKTLPIIVLMACNGQQSTSVVGKEADVESVSQEEVYTSNGTIYATVPYHMRHYGLGYKLNYKCNDSHCMVDGEAHSYAGEILIKNSFNSARLETQGTHASGEVCTQTGQCYDATLVNKGQRFQIDNGTYCLYGANGSNQTNYTSFASSISTTQAFDFNSTTSSICNI